MYEDGNKNLNWLSLVLKLVIVAIIVFLACWIFVKVSNNKASKTNTSDNEYITNIATMKNAAIEYFTKERLPEKVGTSEKLSLNQMINQKLVIDFTNNGKSCDLNESYVQTTMTADGNYALKVNLNCNKKSDFIVTTIESNSCSVTNSCNNVQPVDNKVVEDVNGAQNDPKYNPVKDTKPVGTTNNSTNNNVSNNVASKPATTTTTTVKTTVTIKISCGDNCASSKQEEKTDVFPAVMVTVRFDPNGGKETISNQTFTAGKTAIKPTNPTRDGYTFVEWQLNGKAFDFNTKVAKDITLVAAWKQNTPVTPAKTRYYELYRWTDWVDGYSYNSNAQNKQFQENVYKYCKNEQTKTYYSVGYVTDYTKKNSSYSYEYQMLDLNPNKVIGVRKVYGTEDYFNNFRTDDYYNYLALKRNNSIYMTGNTGKYDIMFNDFYKFRDASLQWYHFSFNVSNTYLTGNSYRTNITINYKDTDRLYPYGNTGAYPVALKFNVAYYNLNDCVNSKTNNYGYYSKLGYTGQFTSTDTVWKHRTYETMFSTSPYLTGWTATGYSELR